MTDVDFDPWLGIRSSVQQAEVEQAPSAARLQTMVAPPPEWSPAQSVSIIIPTRNEAGNIEALLSRLAPVVSGHDVEIIFVDDSTDQTPQVIASAGAGFACPVSVIHREEGHRTGRLGGAVVEGMRAARGYWVIVMDGDLQHPPECIPNLVTTAESSSLDVVVASRYCENGEIGNFDRVRAMVSRGSTIAAKALFPRRLRNVDDPMSGFFLIRRNAVDLDQLHPNGFKILLEIMARTPQLKVSSVPFRFGERFAEASKASIAEGVRYVRSLGALRLGSSAARFGRFGLVGVSGLVINSLLLAFWTETIGIYYLASLLLATQGSSLWNFVLSEYWVFKRSSLPGSRLGRCVRFLAMNNAALLARGPMVFFLTSLLGMNYLLSNLASMAALLLIRFFAADSLIWKQPAPQPIPAPANQPIQTIPQEGEVAA
jgi:dolichol-phosphate mannosyltransferase